MKTELTLSLPPWPPARIVSDAVNEHNLMHADNQLDEHSPWPALCSATVAFLRHRFSNYDQVVSEDNREVLRAQILAEARARYPWLRPEKSPLITRAQVSRFDKRPGEKYLDYLSRVQSEFLSERDLLDLALKQKPDAHTRKELRAHRAQIDRITTTIYERCTHHMGVFHPDCAGLQWIVRTDHIRGQYKFDGLGSYRLEHTGVRCPRCSQAVLQTKTENPGRPG